MARKLLVNLDALGIAKVVNLPTPSASGDAATKAYVDAVKTGLDWKDSVRAASTGNLTLSGPGSTIDGVSMVASDRFLAKDQSTGSQNGIYVWNGAAAAATRSTDADEGTDVTAGLATTVEEGTTNADTIWFITTNNPITLDTTSLSFSQLGTIVNAGTGLTKSGNTISLTIPVAVASGGTNATTAAGARTSLGAPGIYNSAAIGDGAATSFTITHSLNNTDPVVQIYEAGASGGQVEADVQKSSANAVIVSFAVAPTASAYKVTVIG